MNGLFRAASLRADRLLWKLHGLARALFVLRRSCAKSFFVASRPSGTSEAGRTDDARGAEAYYVAKPWLR